MQRDMPFEDGEIYHIYNRGTNKMDIFERNQDHARFMQLLYICNQKTSVHLGNITKQERGLASFYELKRDSPLVSILAYCLMPNHFHLVIRQEVDGGVSQFMQKLATGYSMYFNRSRERTGTLFQGKFKSKHVGDDQYLHHIFSYVHLNPAELHFPNWKAESPIPKDKILSFLLAYTHSSFADYFGPLRMESTIITKDEELPWGETIKKPEDMFDLYEPLPA
jgi:putative transposase